MTNDSASIRQPPEPEGRTFMLCAGFLGTLIGGYWSGIVVALITGAVSTEPPLFPGEYLVASLLLLMLLVGLYVSVCRTDGWRPSIVGFLFVAAFAVLNILCALYLLTPLDTICILPSPDAEPSARSGMTLVALHNDLPPQCRPSPPATSSPLFWVALAPAALVAVLLCSAALRRSALLQLAGVAAGGLFTLSGLLLSLARTLT